MAAGAVAHASAPRPRASGAALLQDAVKRAITVSHDAGVRTWLVRALHERAARF